jgi:hypothetical protein
MGTHLQEFSSYPSEVPTDYHKGASANPGVICETQHLVPGRTSTVAFASFSVERPKIRFFISSSISPHPPLVEYSVQIHGTRQTSYPTCCPPRAHRCLHHHFRRQRTDELGNRQGLARCHQQMDRVGHQHVGVSLAVVPLSRLAQAIEVAMIILFSKNCGNSRLLPR